MTIVAPCPVNLWASLKPVQELEHPSGGETGECFFSACVLACCEARFDDQDGQEVPG